MTSSTKSKNSGIWPLQLSITKTLKHEDFHIFQIWVSVYSLVMDQCTWNQRICSGPSVRSSQKVRKKSRHGPVQVEGFQHLGGFSRYPKLNEWDMDISFEGSSGIWKTYPMRAKPEWDMVSCTPVHVIFILSERMNTTQRGVLHF